VLQAASGTYVKEILLTTLPSHPMSKVVRLTEEVPNVTPHI
jgi:hypothetical protein